MVRTEKRPQEARRQVRHAREAAAEGGEASQGTTREAAAEGGEASQGTTRKAAAEGARREGPGTVQPGKGPPIGEAHAGKACHSERRRQATGRQTRDETNETKRHNEDERRDGAGECVRRHPDLGIDKGSFTYEGKNLPA